VAALRQLLIEVRNRPIAEVFREARATAEWVIATCHPALAWRSVEQAERAGLVAVVEPVVAPDVTVVPDDEVVAALSIGGLAVADHVLIAGLVCCVNTRGELMAKSIDDEALARATTAYLRRIGAREYSSYQDYTGSNQPKSGHGSAGEEDR
jgi:hypothetical protein